MIRTIGSQFEWAQRLPRWGLVSALLLAGMTLTGLPSHSDERARAQSSSAVAARNDRGVSRWHEAQLFHYLAQQPTGLLVPLYVYPGEAHTNQHFNRLIDLKRRFETVPMWVIVNPASGPGQRIDANYTHAIDRLVGAGCVVLGYVSTSYGKIPAATVRADVERWGQFYPRVQGIFFDEMIYEDTPAGATHQRGLTETAHAQGYWPIVANPGAATPQRYFAEQAADVFIVHEGDTMPSEASLHGDYYGGYADYPPHTRAVLLHSQQDLKAKDVAMARRYARWLYFTDDPYRANDPQAANPWDTLSGLTETMCELLKE